MKKLILFFLLVTNTAYSQIKNFEDESQYLLALQELAVQSFTEHYAETDWDEGTRQYLEFDPMTMNFVFYKTPFDEDDNGKLPADIKWLAKSVIPLYEIETLTGDNKKNTITITTKGKRNKYDIQTYHIKSGGEYYAAAQDNTITIQSDKLLKIRNLNTRLNWHISELQKFHQKKMELVNFLNQKLKQEVAYQIKDSLNYRSDKKFKVIQEFQLDSSGQNLSLIVERKDDDGNAIAEKQSVRLKDITAVLKDIGIILKSKENSVVKTTTTTNDKAEKQKIEPLIICFSFNGATKKTTKNSVMKSSIFSNKSGRTFRKVTGTIE